MCHKFYFRTIDFQMDKCLMFFGGLPPDYHDRFATNSRLLKRRPFNSFLGQMRAITISNPGSNSLINPLYTQRYKANPYFGVQPQVSLKLCATLSKKTISKISNTIHDSIKDSTF